MTDQELAIKIRGLRKTYAAEGASAEKIALKGIDLSIPKGSIFGLLGPNGAGKSTTINIIAGVVDKTAGSVEVWGFDTDKDIRNAKANIGIVPQEVHIDAYFTPFEILELYAGFYGIPKAERRSMEILKAMRLEEQRDAYTRFLSGGMKRRLLVGKAMVHNPPILVLDEPTAGVDVELRAHIWQYVRDLNKKGVTIVLTTHYLEEAEELCDEIAIINHGELVICEKTPVLLKQLDEKMVIITPITPIQKLPVELAEIGGKINDNGEIVIHFSPSSISIGDILKKIAATTIEIADLKTEESDLEDIFLQLTRSKEV
ncbi:MAG: ABC transporter ATP-binding protein [Alphaproteobacteria bacterium]|nr:ABC transporter ATP-binding protein [Alphaproteobacteria bacterium]HPF45875.1 ABC transporter ATP-binding protein [Emcibacteraceae bacterium]HRW29468.1 ABC transporter ATP-binding protein [Emcibacteraceae bacterium]